MMNARPLNRNTLCIPRKAGSSCACSRTRVQTIWSQLSLSNSVVQRIFRTFRFESVAADLVVRLLPASLRS